MGKDEIMGSVTTFGSTHAKVHLSADAEQFPGCLTSSVKKDPLGV